MEHRIKEELIKVLDAIETFMYDEVETMWNDENEDWGLLNSVI